MSAITDRVRAFYRQHPYPSYGTTLKTKAAASYARYCEKPGRFLEAGCGTGHVLVGTATALPHLEYWAIDLSEASVAVAERLAREHGANIRFTLHDMMQPLPFDFKFDYISCLGVLHHTDSPDAALRNLASALADDGVLFIHVYGEDYHRRRLQIKELLDLVSTGDGDIKARFRLFTDYAAHARRLREGGLLRRLYRMSLRDVALAVRSRLSRLRSSEGDEWSLHAWASELDYPELTERWIDQFAHPNERTYNLTELHAWLRGAGLEPVEYFALGKERFDHLPPQWRERYETLDNAARARVMELLNPAPTSPFVAVRKIGRTA
jgi:SAM-dependent methyltransferase